MQAMLMFLLISGVFSLGYAGFIKALWVMMQQDQAFDMVSKGGWSAFKDRLYGKNMRGQLITKMLGDCEQCTAFWWSFPYFFVYMSFCLNSGFWWLNWVAGITWFIAYNFINSFIGFYALTYKKKSDVV